MAHGGRVRDSQEARSLGAPKARRAVGRGHRLSVFYGAAVPAHDHVRSARGPAVFRGQGLCSTVPRQGDDRAPGAVCRRLPRPPLCQHQHCPIRHAPGEHRFGQSHDAAGSWHSHVRRDDVSARDCRGLDLLYRANAAAPGVPVACACHGVCGMDRLLATSVPKLVIGMITLFSHQIYFYSNSQERNNSIMPTVVSDSSRGSAAAGLVRADGVKAQSNLATIATAQLDGSAIYEDECQYWANLAQSAKSPTDREDAKSVLSALSSLRQEFLTFHLLSPFKILQVVEAGHELLGDLFATDPAFPPVRAASISRAILASTLSYVRAKLPNLPECAGSLGTLAAAADDLDQCEMILSRCNDLALSNGFPHCPRPPLALDQQALDHVREVTCHIEAIANLVHCIVMVFSAHQDATSWGVGSEILQGIQSDIIFSASGWEPFWEQIDFNMQTIDAALAKYLEEILHESESALAHNGKLFSTALKRKRVQQALTPALKINLSRFQTELQQIETRFHAKRTEMDPIESLMWIRQSLDRLHEMDSITCRLSNDVVGTSYRSQWSKVHAALSSAEAQIVADWVADAEGKLAPGGEYFYAATSRAGKNASPLVPPSSAGGAAAASQALLILDFNDGKLHVTYPATFSTFLRQARVLLALGCRLPPAVTRAAETAQVLLRDAARLCQIAHLYNTIDTQIRDFHKPLLINAAMSFERLATANVAWHDAASVRTFITQLSGVAGDLQATNSRLQTEHDALVHCMIKMMRTPTAQQWQTGITEMLAALAMYATDSVAGWKLHLQMQLYKVMRRNYAVTLRESQLAAVLPEVRADVTIRGGRLVLRPSLEEVKAKYYREVRRIISAPLTLRGLVDGENYSEIIEYHATDLLEVYRKAEATFDELDKKLNAQYGDWTVVTGLSQDRVKDLVTAQSVTVADWGAHFRTIKQRGKDAEMLPNTVKVDNIVVSALPLKAAIDDFLQRLFDVLVSTLLASVTAHARVVQDYLATGIALLSEAPTSVQGIAKARETHAKLRAEDPSHHLAQIQNKQKLLRAVVGTASDLSDLFNQYSQFDLMVKGHELMIADHFDNMLTQLDARSEKITQQLHRLHQDICDSAATTKTSSASSSENAAGTTTSASDYLQALLDIDVLVHALQDDCRFFSVPVPPFPELDECHRLVEEAVAAQKLGGEFTESIGKLQETAVTQLHTEDLQQVLDAWKARLGGIKLTPTTLAIQKVLDAIQLLLQNWGSLFGDLKRFTVSHWSEFCALLAIPTTNRVQVSHLLERTDAIQSKRSTLSELGVRARNEAVVRDALQEVELWAVSCTLALQPVSGNARAAGGVPLVQEFKSILSELSDQRSVISSLQASANAAAFAELLAFWDKRMQDLDQFLRSLQTVQKRWAYLAPVISALPAPQQQKFATVDSMFRTLMQHASTDARVLPLLSLPLASQISTAVASLQACQKCLLEYLEEKRNAFPRFYFIGDEDLLEILSQSATNPRVIQLHLKKLFSGLSRVIMDANSVVGIASAKGEEVMLSTPVPISERVEAWLAVLCTEIASTLSKLLADCVSGARPNFTYPEQISDLAYRITMTAKIEEAITAGSLTALSQSIGTESYESIYYGRVVRDLAARKIARTDDFYWQQYLRFYFIGGSKCVIRAFSTEFEYSFEYQGNPSKLVQTPLTDTCFATLTQAMSEGLGGCLYGPAGTGKTESVKALGYLFGRQVLVFNCDEALDVASITRLFCGIVKCGAWGCFDEFNRLTASVLAAVSNLVSTIQNALLHKLPQVTISGHPVSVHSWACLFVTLNPAGKQYKGRQQLPTNLKQLFRNIAMTHPDVAYICQIELKAQGFHENPDGLGHVTVDFFSACKCVLSAQRHYDWGLRALKAVLMTAGELRRHAPAQETDQDIVAQAMRLGIESKLTSGDVTTFQGLVATYFSSRGTPVVPKALRDALAESSKVLGVVPADWQLSAAVQFSSACEQRMGVCLTGAARSGKLTVIRLVADAWTRQGRKTVLHTVSPKAMKRHRLLGYMDSDTREWHDGVLTLYAREAIVSPDVHHLIVMDGDVDPEWIEALNSVLDDNRLLTMPNGERIKFESNVNFVFATDSLRFASPATVSRLSIVFLVGSFASAPQDTACQMFTGSIATGRKGRVAAAAAAAATARTDAALVKPIWVQCTREASSDTIIEALFQLCAVVSGQEGQVLVPKGAPPNAGISLHLCDIDLPIPDVYETVELQQFVHQLIQHRGFHHPKTLDWIQIRHLTVLCTAKSTGGLAPRLAKKFSCVAVDAPSTDAFAEETMAAFREKGIEPRLASRIVAVLAQSFGTLPLAAKKCKSILLLNPSMSDGDERTVAETLRRAISLAFPPNCDLVASAFTKEFGNIPQAAAASSLALAERESGCILAMPQFNEFATKLKDALVTSFPIVRIDAKQGIPALATLAAVCASMNLPLSNISYVRGPSMPTFLAQLKDAIATTGVRNQPACLLVEPQACPSADYYQVIHQIVAQSALEALPDLTEAEATYQQVGYQGTLQDFVFSRCIANLKVVVLNMRRDWLEGFPLFLTHSVALSWTDWDTDAQAVLCKPLSPVQANYLQTAYLARPTRIPAQMRQIASLVGSIGNRLRDRLSKRRDFLQSGLDKLKSTKQAVDKLSGDAGKQARELQEKQTQADSYLKQITDTMMNVSTQKAEMEQLTAKLSQEEGKIQIQKEEIQAELLSVEPLITKAKSAVGDIKSEHLSEVRSLRAPPDAVRDVLEGVLRLLGQQDVSWAAMKAVLGKRSFKEDVLNFNAGKISATARNQVEALMRQKPNSFIEANVRKSSVAAAPLATWVTANLEYSRVMERVQPLQNQLNAVNASLESSRQRIVELNDAVENVDKTVAKLKIEFAEKTGEAQRLATALDVTTKNLERARLLLDSLLSEEVRWLKQLDDMSVRLESMDAVALCLAMYCVWCPGLTEQLRDAQLTAWAAALGIAKPSLVAEFTEDFPAAGIEDTISLENVIMAHLSSGSIAFWVADGNGLGLPAIQKVFSPKVVSVLSDAYVKELEMAIRLGQSIVLMDAKPESLHPWLYAVLRQEYAYVHGRALLSIGEKQLEVNPQFRVFMYTPSAGWELPSALEGPLLTLCWSTTSEGLTARLLRAITLLDSPAVLEQLTELEVQESNLRESLVKLETQLLHDLSSSDGDILSNEKLFSSLMAAKEQGIQVTQALAQSQQLHAQLKGQQSQYLDILPKISAMYFLVRGLVEIHPHYRFSLKAFLDWFRASIIAHPARGGSTGAQQQQHASQHQLQQQRMQDLLGHFARSVYRKVTSGMDAGHHAAVGLNLLLAAGSVTLGEVEAFCGLVHGGAQGQQQQQKGGAPVPAWVPVERRAALGALAQVVDLRILAEREAVWRQWLARDIDAVGDLTNPFHQVLIAQAVCPDTLQRELSRFVQVRLGSGAVSDLPSIVSQSTQAAVLLFVHAGADPVTLLGSSLGPQARIVSLGQGMEEEATLAVQTAMAQGTGVFIQNLQALPGWISKAAALVQDLHTQGEGSDSAPMTHATTAAPGFRLVLSCEVNTVVLPVELLEHCTLVNVQVLPGFQQNLGQALATVSNLKSNNGNNSIQDAQTLFLLAWLHAVLQERRNFLPQAWQKYYEFGAADFASLVRIAANSGTSDMATVRGIAHLIYGGHIDVPFDAHKLRLLLDLTLHEDILGTGGRVPGRKLVRGFQLPTSNDLKGFEAALETLAKSDIRDYHILQLPPNISTTVDALAVRVTIDLVKRLMRKVTPSRGPPTTSASVTVPVAERSTGDQSVAQFLGLWKKSIIARTPLVEDKYASPLAKIIARQFNSLLEQVAALQQRVAALKAQPDPALVESIVLSNTPDEWQTIVAQPNLAHFPRDVERVLSEVASTVQACEAQGAVLVLAARILDVSLSIPSPAGFLCVLQQMTAVALKLPVTQLTLLAWFSAQPGPPPLDDSAAAATVPSVSVRTVWLQGATVEGGKLAAVTSSTAPSVMSTGIQLGYVPSSMVTDSSGAGSGSRSRSSGTALAVPIYTDISREALAVTVHVLVEDAATAAALSLAGVTLLTFVS